ncbi:MAG TPA: hypothetical protein VKZ85_02085 [Woeseiaceae bacterium]|nr:hypothetical protein [Woeseiaceae bacterium]
MQRTRRTTIIIALSLLVACAGHPERTSYAVDDFRARWLDRFEADSRACRHAGGTIVQDRHEPGSIRLGNAAPEIGTRYWCVRH